MSRDLICSWLGLAPGDWPPDHYRLLGLEPGEADVDRIEQQVHQRLESVRRYQLLHPEAVTEAMNRLAQAYVCLTDPTARRAYDAARQGRPGSSPRLPASPPPSTAPAAPPPVTVRPAPVEGRSRPAPPRAAPSAPLPASAAPPPLLALPAPPPPPSVAPAETVAVASPTEHVEPPLPEVPEVPEGPPAAPATPAPPTAAPATGADAPTKLDHVVEVAESATARRGLGTKRGVYRRLAATRRVLRAWEAAGKYLATPARRLTRPSEATELINQMKAIRAALERFPKLLGDAGQPGYSVVLLARQPAPVPIFQTLLPSQRETLAQHWRSGRQLLEAHREYLRREARSLKKKSFLGRAWRATRATVTDQPGIVLLLLALIALNIAIVRQFWLRG